MNEFLILILMTVVAFLGGYGTFILLEWLWDGSPSVPEVVKQEQKQKQYQIYLLGKPSKGKVEEFLAWTSPGRESDETIAAITADYWVDEYCINGRWKTTVDKQGFQGRTLVKYKSIKFSRQVELI